MKYLASLLLLSFCLSGNAQLEISKLKDHTAEGFPSKVKFINQNGDHLVFYTNRVALYDNSNKLVKTYSVKNAMSASYDPASGKTLIQGKAKNEEVKQKEVTDKVCYLFSNGIFGISNDYRIFTAQNGDTNYFSQTLSSSPKQVELIGNNAVILTKENQLLFLELTNRQLIKIEKLESKALSLSSNSDLLVSLHRDNTAIVWNPQTAGIHKQIKIKIKGKIISSALSDDNKYLVFGTDLGNIALASLKNDRKIDYFKKYNFPATSISFKPNSSIFLVTFDYTKRVCQFSASGETEPLFKRKIKDIQKQDVFPPQIYIASRSGSEGMNIRTKNDMYKLTGRVFDESGVHQLVINETDVPFKEDGKFTMYISLSPGDNLVKLTASDTKNNIGTEEITITLMDQNEVAYVPGLAQNHLLIVGINEYQNFSVLNNAVHDAQALDSILLANYKIEPKNVTALYNSEATLENINSSFRNLIKNISPNDNLIVYFAGHGIYDNTLNEGYWIPVDAQRGKFTTYYPNSLLLKTIKSIEAQHILVLADACFSGSLLSSKTNRSYLTQAGQYKSRRVITSGRLETVADGSGIHSPFSETLINYLLSNKGQDITVAELELFMKKNFPSGTNQTPRFGVLNNVGDEGGEFILLSKK